MRLPKTALCSVIALALTFRAAPLQGAAPAPKAKAQAKKSSPPAQTKARAAVSASRQPQKNKLVGRGRAFPAPQRWRPAQLQPSSDRYREIQQSLVDHGYPLNAVDGNWGSESIDALKRFQKDQNLEADGKLGSLTLIALGLGSPHGKIPSKVAHTSTTTVDNP